MIGSATGLRMSSQASGKMHLPSWKIRHEGEMPPIPASTFLVLVDEGTVPGCHDGRHSTLRMVDGGAVMSRLAGRLNHL